MAAVVALDREARLRWVLGDIHGMFGPLEAILEAVARRDPAARFYFVGDYVNRGPGSRRVVELLSTLPDARFVRGNHDDVLDLILNGRWRGGEDDAFDPAAACAWFLRHGLLDTLVSYGFDHAHAEHHGSRPTAAFLRSVREAFPESHRRFFRELPITVEEADLFVAHAFWPPEEPNDDAHVAARLDGDAGMAHRVIWERWTHLQVLSDKPWARPAFFGHTPVTNYPASMRGDANRPVVGPRVTLLDTAVALGAAGRLSAVCVEDGRLVQVDRECRVIT